MFIAALFPIAQRVETLQISINDDWINKMWYIHTIRHSLKIKRTKVRICVIIWVNIKSVILIEGRQA